MSGKTIAIIRGSRPNVVSFYEKFERFKVKYISASFKSFDHKSTKKNFEFINLPYYNFLKFDPARLITQYGNLSFAFIKNLEEHLGGVDIINISDTYYFSNLQAVNWALKNKVPIVTVVWCTIPNHITTWFPPYSFITKKIVEATDLFILRSRTTLKFSDSLNIPRSKTKVIYKGIDLQKFSPSPVTSHRSQITILFTGNLSRAKGLDDLLCVFEELRRHYKDLRLIVAGSGEMREQVKRLSLSSTSVEFRGFVPYKRLPDLYREADIYCAPSKDAKIFGIKYWEEYFSYTLMEAQASSLPIVSTHSGGICEEVGDGNLLVAQGDTDALKTALESLILDKNKREKIGRQNRARAEKFFDEKIQAQRTEEAILKLL